MARIKKHSKALPFIIIVCLIVALFIGYRVLTASAGTAGTDTPVNDDVTMIVERDPSEISRLSYSIYGGKELSFAYNSALAAWRLADDSSFPLNQETVAAMATAVSSIGVFRTLETGDTGEFGFASPNAVISVSYTDGTANHYAIGNLNPTTGYYYFKDTDTGTVYTISSGLLPYFEYELADLFVYDKLPEDVQQEYITSVTLKVGEQVKELTDADSIAKVYEAYGRLTPTEYLDWKTDDATKAKYGMGKAVLTINYKRAVQVTDTSGATMTTRASAVTTVTFGETKDGTTPYSLGNSGVIYGKTETSNAVLNDLLVAFGMSLGK